MPNSNAVAITGSVVVHITDAQFTFRRLLSPTTVLSCWLLFTRFFSGNSPTRESFFVSAVHQIDQKKMGLIMCWINCADSEAGVAVEAQRHSNMQSVDRDDEHQVDRRSAEEILHFGKVTTEPRQDTGKGGGLILYGRGTK